MSGGTAVSDGGRGVLEGAFALLETVEKLEVAGLTRLAADSGLPKTTVHRLLEQLIELGVVERSPGRGHYRLGRRLHELGREWQPYPGLKTAAAATVRSLAAATGVTVGICVLRNGQTLAVDGTTGDMDPQLALVSGTTWPWSTAAGKLLVATARPGLPLGPMPGTWNRTAAAIRADGLAIDREELIPGVFCVATPVYAPRNTVVAALTVLTGSPKRLPALVPLAAQAGRVISENLRVP